MINEQRPTVKFRYEIIILSYFKAEKIAFLVLQDGALS